MTSGFGQRTAPQQPFASPPSAAPASSSLYARPAAGLQLPDLAAFVEGWHKGKTATDSTGKRVQLAWHCIEVIHLDTATVVYIHECDASEEDLEVVKILTARIEHRARGMGDGGLQRFEVRCHFRNEDGTITKWEPYTVPVTLPPQTPHWGQAHYGGMGAGGGPGGWGGGSGLGGGVSAYGGHGGGGFGGPQAFAASLHRGYLDATQLSHTVLFRALDLVENHSRRLEASNARHEEREIDRLRLMDELTNTAQTRKLQEQMAELKIAAIEAGLSKFLTSLPLGFVVLNRWLSSKKQKEDGTASPREKKALDTLRKISNELQKNPMLAENPGIVRGMLQQAGVTEETLDDTFGIFQEFAFDKMMENAEENIKKSLLGIKDDGEGGGLKRLLKLAGMAKEEPISANDAGVRVEAKDQATG